MAASLEECEAAGLVDVPVAARGVRVALIEFLLESGATVDEMVAALRRGRLFALAGDRIATRPAVELLPGQVASVVAASEDFAVDLIASLGLARADDRGRLQMTFDELAAIRSMVDLADVLGEHRVVALARIIRSSMDVVADAFSATIRASFADASVALSDEAAAARALASRMPYLLGLERAFWPILLRGVIAAREQFEHSNSYDIVLDGQTRIAIGFVDLSGFTSLSTSVSLNVIERLLTRFETAVRRAADSAAVRIVKFIGDEAMLVSATTDELVSVVARLVGDPIEVAGVTAPARGGIAFGEVLARNGDYFGPDVNLAARLVTAAPSGVTLLSPRAAGAIDRARWEVTEDKPASLKGFTESVHPYRLVPSTPPSDTPA